MTGFQPGDEVFGTTEGSFAEYAVAKPGKLALKPTRLSFQQAAAVPISGATALQAVRNGGGVQPGEKVLIIGASGGVGSFAVQIAKALGAEVTGVASSAKLDFVRSLGADRVVDYSHEDVTEGETHYDVIIDIGGRTPVSHLRRAMTPKGRLVLVGGMSAGRWLGGLGRQIRAQLLSPLVGQSLKMLMATENADDLVVLADLIDAGRVTPAIDRAYPLSEAPAAIRHLLDGDVRGKVVITV